MGHLIDILIGVVSGIVTGELRAHVEPIARWIISKAVERLPADERDRFREEWASHLDEMPGMVRKLGHALGCYIGVTEIAGVLERERKRSTAPRQIIQVIGQDVLINGNRHYLRLRESVGDHKAYIDGFALSARKGRAKRTRKR
jgi:hypothetical protein